MKVTDTNADMNHQNSLGYKIKEFLISIKHNGIISTVDKIAQRVNYKIKGVDFSTQNIFDLTLTGDHKDNGTALVSSSKDFLKMLLDDLESLIDKNIDKNIFLDYGSGKGGGIIHAKGLGFSKTIGIEFAKELNDIANSNIEKLSIDNVKSIHEDATKYLPPLDVSIIYLFNPFDKIVMDKVAQNILSLQDKFENDVYIIYANVSCDVLDNYFTILDKKKYKSGASAHYYKVN
jgi:16S rRNA G966 N2-methylase RsmD